MKEELTLRKIDFRVATLPLLAISKFSVFILHAGIFLFLHNCLALVIRNEKKRLKAILRSNSFHADLLLRYLGMEISHEEGVTPVRGKLIICNHLSYLDALVLFKLYPSLFVTSREIENTPGLGQITRLAGCFFIERRKDLRTPELAEKEMALMRNRLSQGFNIFLFPEGTSSDGSEVLPFKAHFFQLAIDNGICIQPLMIKYHGTERKLAPWYGHMDFISHFFRICRSNSLSVVVKKLPPIFPEGKDRFSLKDEAYKMIRSEYESD